MAFAARTAAEQLGKGVSLLQATVAGLAANPQIAQVLATPESCTLTFAGAGGLERGHLDLVRADGTIACSSLTAEERERSYGGEEWLAQANAGSVFLAPVVDAATGAQAALSAVAVSGGAVIVAGFVDLEPAGAALADLYGGGLPVEFLVTSADGATVIARSHEPGRWIGASLADTAFSRTSESVERIDLDGTARIY